MAELSCSLLVACDMQPSRHVGVLSSFPFSEALKTDSLLIALLEANAILAAGQCCRKSPTVISEAPQLSPRRVSAAPLCRWSQRVTVMKTRAPDDEYINWQLISKRLCYQRTQSSGGLKDKAREICHPLVSSSPCLCFHLESPLRAEAELSRVLSPCPPNKTLCTTTRPPLERCFTQQSLLYSVHLLP